MQGRQAGEIIQFRQQRPVQAHRLGVAGAAVHHPVADGPQGGMPHRLVQPVEQGFQGLGMIAGVEGVNLGFVPARALDKQAGPVAAEAVGLAPPQGLVGGHGVDRKLDAGGAGVEDQQGIFRHSGPASRRSFSSLRSFSALTIS